MTSPMPDFSALRGVHQEHMWDVVRRLEYSRTINEAGQPVETWVEVPFDILCGYSPKGGVERASDNLTTLTWDAVIRLQGTTILDSKDRLKLIRTKTEPVDPALVYEIVGPVQPGPTVMLLRVKKVDV